MSLLRQVMFLLALAPLTTCKPRSSIAQVAYAEGAEQTVLMTAWTGKAATDHQTFFSDMRGGTFKVAVAAFEKHIAAEKFTLEAFASSQSLKELSSYQGPLNAYFYYSAPGDLSGAVCYRLTLQGTWVAGTPFNAENLKIDRGSRHDQESDYPSCAQGYYP